MSNHKVKVVNEAGGFIYFLGIIGSAVYFMGQTTGFWNDFGSLLQALVWPAFLVYEVFKALGA